MPTSLSRRRVRRLFAATAALVLAGSLTACGGGDDSDDAGKPILRVGVQKDGIRSVLEQSGQLDDLPYEIEWSEFTAGPPIVEAASADKIDVAWVGSAPPIFGAASGGAFNAVAAVQEADRYQDSVLVPKGSSIASLEDLKGKKIAVGKGTSAHGLLLNVLDAAGLTFDDVEVAYLAPPEGLAAFQSGDVDAWATWDPFVTQEVSQNGAIDLTADHQELDPYLQFLISSEKSLQDDGKREDITDYVGRVGEAFAWAKDNPDAWGEGWAAESGLPVEVTTAVAKKKQNDVVPISDELIANEQALADSFAEAGELPEKIDFSTVVDNVLQ